jgi:hypothetical protein
VTPNRFRMLSDRGEAIRLACAFAVAHRFSDITAAIRFDRRLVLAKGGDERDLSGYLDSAIFELNRYGAWGDWRETREEAQEFLDGLAEPSPVISSTELAGATWHIGGHERTPG